MRNIQSDVSKCETEDGCSAFITWMISGCGGNGPDDEPCAPYILGSVYGILALVVLTQLIRIQCRVMECTLTMQKTFHLFNLLICLLRTLSLFFFVQIRDEDSHGLETLFVDLPSIFFFTTYMILVLFWAEIIHTAIPKNNVN